MQVRQVAKAGLIRQFLVRNGWSVLTITTHAARPGWLVVGTDHRRLVVQRVPVKVKGTVLVHAPHRWASAEQDTYQVQNLTVLPLEAPAPAVAGNAGSCDTTAHEAAVREAVVAMCRTLMASPLRPEGGVCVPADEEGILLAGIRERRESMEHSAELAQLKGQRVAPTPVGPGAPACAATADPDVSAAVAPLYSQLFALHELT